MDNRKKVLLTGSLLAGALFATANFNANAADLFRFRDLGSGEAVKARLMDGNADGRSLQLNCGAKKRFCRCEKR